MIALAGSTSAFQPLMAPLGLEKMKVAGLPLTVKPSPGLNTWPVGAPPGMATSVFSFLPVPE